MTRPPANGEPRGDIADGPDARRVPWEHEGTRTPDRDSLLGRPVTRRALLTAAFGVAGAAALVPPVANVYRHEVNRYTVPLPGLRGPLRAVQLSDLHFGPFVGRHTVRSWVNSALHARPDVILITGDFVDHAHRGPVTGLLEELSRLAAPLGVWGVWGNHDVAWLRRGGRAEGSREQLAARLGAGGVRMLRNEGVDVRDDLRLLGLDDLRNGQPNLQRTLAAARGDRVNLLLSHNPDVLPQVPVGIPLTLSGHTHGGQVRLPLVGAVVTSSRYGDRFAQGFVNGPARGFVSRGLGVSNLPVRLNCTPEVVVLDFQPA